MDATSLEIVKIIFLFSFLSVNTYFDIRYRSIFGDSKINTGIGLFAVSIIFYGYWIESNLDIFYILITSIIPVVLWAFKKIPSGDCIVLLVIGMILPSTQVIPLFSFFSLCFAMLVFFIYFITHNVILNCITFFKTNSLFTIYDMPFYQKIFYFFFVHEKRSWEKYVQSITIGKKSQLLKQNTEFNLCKVNGRIVSSLVPFMPFLLFTVTILLFLDFYTFPRL